MNDSPAAAAFPPRCALIEVHVSDVKELFNSFDPTPFHKRDLDPSADEFITGWARESGAGKPLGLLVHVDHAAASPHATETVQGAVRDHFARSAEATRRRLRLLFANGRIALLIGLGVVAATMIIGDAIENLLSEYRVGGMVRESLLIGGWVAMWRPLEVFLYDWWPIRADARLFDRLSAMTVRVVRTRQN